MLDSYIAEGRSRIQIEKIVTRFLMAVSPDQLKEAKPLNVEFLIDSGLSTYCDVKLDLVDELEDGREAELDILEKKIRFTNRGWDRLCEGNARSRFTGCHEIYHAIDHLPQFDLFNEKFWRSQLTLARQKRQTYQNPEWQAEHGAGVMLMPACTAIPFYKMLSRRGLKELHIQESIVDKYEVSESAAETRMRALKKDVLLWNRY